MDKDKSSSTITKEWKESGTRFKSNISIQFGSPPSGVWTTLNLDLSFTDANGDMDIELIKQSIGIDADGKYEDSIRLNVYKNGNLEITGHISHKNTGLARGHITATANYGPKSVLTANEKNILFAHGMNDDKSAWDKYVKAVSESYKDYSVFRTSVDGCGHIQDRAHQLAEYINTACANIPDGSLIAVGHSMGGLDLRYIIGKANSSSSEPFYSAAKKIKSVFTIATPHHGVDIAALKPDAWEIICDPAINDLKNEAMDNFNKQFPYTKFFIPGTKVKIPFMAYHFVCYGFTDGLVTTNYQSWHKAPLEIGGSRIGGHIPFFKPCTAELDQMDVVLDILERMDNVPTVKLA